MGRKLCTAVDVKKCQTVIGAFQPCRKTDMRHQKAALVQDGFSDAYFGEESYLSGTRS